MRIEKITTESDFKKCTDIVQLNYNCDLVLGNLNENTYLGCFDPKNELIAFLGFCTSPMDDRYYELFALNTHPDHWNMGYATTLLDGFITYLSKFRKDIRVLLTCNIDKEAYYKKRKYQTLIITKKTCIMYYTNG